MGKKSISRTETQIVKGDTVGKQLNQIVMVDDNALPSPQDLEAYKQIDPNIITCIIDATIKEQAHRHYMETSKMELLKADDRKTSRLNLWGLIFAFLSLLSIIAFSWKALSLDRPWFAGLFGGISTVTIVSVFLNAGGKEIKQ